MTEKPLKYSAVKSSPAHEMDEIEVSTSDSPAPRGWRSLSSNFSSPFADDIGGSLLSGPENGGARRVHARRGLGEARGPLGLDGHHNCEAQRSALHQHSEGRKLAVAEDLTTLPCVTYGTRSRTVTDFSNVLSRLDYFMHSHFTVSFTYRTSNGKRQRGVSTLMICSPPQLTFRPSFYPLPIPPSPNLCSSYRPRCVAP